MRRARALTTAWLLACALPGCAVFDASKLDDAGADVDGGAPDAGSDAGAVCTPRRPPARPSVADSGDDEVAFALRDVRLDQRTVRWRTIGYDLDGLCSEPGATRLECEPPDAPPGEPIDGEGGIDNAFGQWMAPLLLFLVPAIEEEARAEQEAGNLALVVQVRAWNGGEDDPQVEVAVSHSARATDASGDAPAWDGTDRWWSRTDGFFDGDPARALLRDDNAYVAGGTLVAHLPLRSEVIVPGGDARLRLRLTDTVLTARIDGAGASLSEVTLAGRWALIDLASAAGELGLCNPTDRAAFVDPAQGAADVRSAPGTGGDGVSCDAISLGLAFTGTRIEWQGLEDGPPLPEPCP